MLLSTGLNIESDVAAILSFNKHAFTGKVYKGEYMQVYKLELHIPSRFINVSTVINVQKELLEQVQEDIRVAKIGRIENITHIPYRMNSGISGN